MPAFDPELIIFDCDSVLVDTERVNSQVMADLVGELGVPMSFAEAVELAASENRPRIACALPKHASGARLRTICTHAGWHARASCMRVMRAVEGIRHCCPCWRAVLRGLNGRHAEIRQNLRLTGLLPWFEGRMFSSEDVARPKMNISEASAQLISERMGHLH